MSTTIIRKKPAAKKTIAKKNDCRENYYKKDNN